MFTQYNVRPAEHLHSVKCYANALQNALENLRDQEGMTDHTFALIIDNEGGLTTEARAYLNDGLVECQCGPCVISCCDNVDQSVTYRGYVIESGKGTIAGLTIRHQGLLVTSQYESMKGAMAAIDAWVEGDVR